MRIPMGWRCACIVNLYKGKDDKCECSNSRGISVLSVVGNLNYIVECRLKELGPELNVQ